MTVLDLRVALDCHHVPVISWLWEVLIGWQLLKTLKTEPFYLHVKKGVQDLAIPTKGGHSLAFFCVLEPPSQEPVHRRPTSINSPQLTLPASSRL